MTTQPRLGILAFLDIPVDCRMTGELNEEGDAQFTVGGPYDEFDIVFEPAALYRFTQLAFDLLCQAARNNPQALTARATHDDAAPFEYHTDALQKLATLSKTHAQINHQPHHQHTAPTGTADTGRSA